jgi:hypothetical protein
MLGMHAQRHPGQRRHDLRLQAGAVAGVDQVRLQTPQYAEHAQVVQGIAAFGLVQVDDVDAVLAHARLVVAAVMQADDGVAIALGGQVTDQVEQTVFQVGAVERFHEVHDQPRRFAGHGRRHTGRMMGAHVSSVGPGCGTCSGFSGCGGRSGRGGDRGAGLGNAAARRNRLCMAVVADHEGAAPCSLAAMRTAVWRTVPLYGAAYRHYSRFPTPLTRLKNCADRRRG